MVKFTVNGSTRQFDGDPDMPLLWYLREEAGLKGTKYGCGIGQCGACTVHVDGDAVRSCGIPVSTLDGTRVTTIEGLAQGETLHKVQEAWLAEDVAQCGYCQTGQIMAAVALLAATPKPTDAEINAGITNICRCATYNRIRNAIHRAAG
ncbi:(2Fe-2S)-binding protein [Niveispirillum cyanobacteriorum]|uniref:(2Fe-2S)-binding protein n=1 Tax=Niveispirillum cyanobacteriorum TaxID=1612173 RepID=A0A2K9NDI5_9PROT|nr:(2Fe-2S)-binding protein [Niveispirillum cyanobacteriorum]AUN31052.1 (2Fe-2S)-binding protein [Niveispirillum cyanobacteriorum]GGE84047.1 (2Fe-2S)-binding protein [Niveispirillum cyanobacteriorum]